MEAPRQQPKTGRAPRAPKGAAIGRWTAGGLLLLALGPAAGWLLLADGSRAQEGPNTGPGRETMGTGPAVDAAGASGQQLYAKYCAQCHGDKGDGRGYAAPFLVPAPRDFTSGKYQIRSTPTGALPTDDDIRRAIRNGIPYTAMPAFPDFSDGQVDQLVTVLKGFSPKFASGQAPAPLELAADPGYSEERMEEARKVYQSIGCAGCHGQEGRGDGPSAPTLVDDWGQKVRAADLTRPWTFNGGATREDVFRSLSTGLNGTPMAGFQSALTDEQRWLLVDFITSLSGGATSAGYDNLLVAQAVEGDLDLAKGRELFAGAEPALFPLFGQIVQPGRNFHPAVIAVEARAVYSADEVAVMVSWHDYRADRGGNNGPDFALPEEEEHPGLATAPAAAPGGRPADPFADEETAGDPFADEEQAPADPFADEEAEPAAADPFADEEAAADPFADEEAGGAAAPATSGTEFSDAVAVQFPRALTGDVRRPYFIFGDPQNPVELWFVDLANAGLVELWEGRGSDQLEPGEGTTPEVQATYDHGEWTVVYKRRRNAGSGVSFGDDSFVPVAFSVWDGSAGERGNKRALSAWYNLYVPPAEQPSPVVPMARAAGIVLFLELLIVFLARRRRRQGALGAPASPAPSGA
jgi:mono/diheme cytochrome c family protein